MSAGWDEACLALAADCDRAARLCTGERARAYAHAAQMARMKAGLEPAAAGTRAAAASPPGPAAGDGDGGDAGAFLDDLGAARDRRQLADAIRRRAGQYDTAHFALAFGVLRRLADDLDGDPGG